MEIEMTSRALSGQKDGSEVFIPFCARARVAGFDLIPAPMAAAVVEARKVLRFIPGFPPRRSSWADFAWVPCCTRSRREIHHDIEGVVATPIVVRGNGAILRQCRVRLREGRRLLGRAIAVGALDRRSSHTGPI